MVCKLSGTGRHDKTFLDRLWTNFQIFFSHSGTNNKTIACSKTDHFWSKFCNYKSRWKWSSKRYFLSHCDTSECNILLKNKMFGRDLALCVGCWLVVEIESVPLKSGGRWMWVHRYGFKRIKCFQRKVQLLHLD